MASTDQTTSGVIDANGNLTIRLRPDNNRTWTVTQVGISADTVGGGAIGKLKKNGKIIAPFVATGDAPWGEQPLAPTETLTVEWTSGTPGGTAEVTFFYDDGVPA